VSRLQKVVTLSMTEAEYVAMIEACKKLIWLKDFMKEFDKDQVTSLYNQNAINLANSPVYHDKLNHIEVQYYFICIFLKDGVLSLVKIHMSQDFTDIQTKVVTIEKLKNCSASIGLLG